MVVDVAENKNGKKAIMLAEGNTPARNIHVMRNLTNPFRFPWFMLDENAELMILFCISHLARWCLVVDVIYPICSYIFSEILLYHKTS